MRFTETRYPMTRQADVVTETSLDLPVFGKGKVRDTYDLGDKLLIVATDRISAFDSVLPNGIPDKGLVLNQLSGFWFRQTSHIVPNHLIKMVGAAVDLKEYAPGASLPGYLTGRSMVVRKAERLAVECVVRGYISGSAWAEYKRTRSVCGIVLPAGLLESEKLPRPLFTPTTKAEAGHDEPITLAQLAKLVGRELAREMERASIAIYESARQYAIKKGIIIADTKFEFGLVSGKLTLIDELLTPDSSRFWDVAQYAVGSSPPSFDKQPVRDWLVASGWNKEPPAPPLPRDVVEACSRRYREAYERLAGRKLEN